MTFQKPKQWSSWLSLAEWWYNTNFHSALKMTLFQALYGFPPQQHIIDTCATWSEAENRWSDCSESNYSRVRIKWKYMLIKRGLKGSLSLGTWITRRSSPISKLQWPFERIWSPAWSTMVLSQLWQKWALWLTNCNCHLVLESILSSMGVYLRRDPVLNLLQCQPCI